MNSSKSYKHTDTVSQKTTQFWILTDVYQANTATLAPLSPKEDKILIKSLQECKGYNAWQFITEFLNKGWTKTASTGCWWSSEQLTTWQASSSGQRQTQCACWWKRRHSNELLLLSQEDKPQRATEQSEKFYVRREIHHWSPVSQIIHKDLRLKCYKKRFSQRLTWSAQHARVTRYFRWAVWETITW